MFDKICLVGVGLINGSLAKDLKRLGLARTITGLGRDRERLSGAQSAGLIDGFALLADADVAGADLVVLGVPVAKTAQALEAIRPSLGPATLLTDVGSTKCSVIQAARQVFGGLPGQFVPGHPIAGSERTGYEHAKDRLFDGCRVILTPTESTDAQALQRIRALWQAVGAEVDELSADRHDLILSATSHLPHMVAYTLVNYLEAKPEAEQIFDYAAAGFYDFTRIASSSPAMWTDICIANREQLLVSIEGFGQLLKELHALISDGKEEALHAFLEQAKHLRDHNSAKK